MKILSDNRTIDELIESLEIRQQKKKNDGKFEENKFQEVIQVLKKLNVGTSFDLSSQSSISVLDATERKALAYGTTVQGLDVVEGVIVTETSTGKTFTLITPDPTLDASWVEISNTGTVTFPDLIIQGQSQINYDNIVNAPITPQVSLTVNAESRTTANLVATYDNGTAGVGATLTMNSVGAFASQDGINIITSSTKYLLVVNQTDAKQNGLYLLTTDGDGSTQAVLTRAVEFDEISEVNNYSVKVNAGTLYASKQYYVLTNINTIGTDNINFAEVSAASVSQATESIAGIAELATQAETNTGTDDLRMVTPLKLKNANFLAGSINLGTIRFVSKNGNDGTALVGRIDKPYLTIQAAITAAASGDTVYVFQGTYTENVSVSNKSITLFLSGNVLITASSGNTVSLDVRDNNNIVIEGNGTISNTATAGTAIILNNPIPASLNNRNITIRNINITATGATSSCINRTSDNGDRLTSFSLLNCKITGTNIGVVLPLSFLSAAYITNCVIIASSTALTIAKTTYINDSYIQGTTGIVTPLGDNGTLLRINNSQIIGTAGNAMDLGRAGTIATYQVTNSYLQSSTNTIDMFGDNNNYANIVLSGCILKTGTADFISSSNPGSVIYIRINNCITNGTVGTTSGIAEIYSDYSNVGANFIFTPTLKNI